MNHNVLFRSKASEFPFFIRSFQVDTDYDACVDLIRLSMNSIRFQSPTADEVAPLGMNVEIDRILTSDMQPGDAGIPAHYLHAPRSAFWVAIATAPDAKEHHVNDATYPFVAGMLALRPSRVGAPEYATLCAERGFDIDTEATLNRMVTSTNRIDRPSRRRALPQNRLYNLTRAHHLAGVSNSQRSKR
jgi:hypothetical protein